MKTEYDFFKERIAEVSSALVMVGKVEMEIRYVDLLTYLHDAQCQYHKYLEDLPDEIADIPEDYFDPIP